MTAMLGTTGRCQIRLRRLGGVVYVNLCGRLDERAMTALLQVALPLLTGSSFRRMILDLYDVEDAERLAPGRLDPLRALAESHRRQLAVLMPMPGGDDLAAARRRRRHRAIGAGAGDALGADGARPCRAQDLHAS
jgi:hypothetical protein